MSTIAEREEEWKSEEELLLPTFSCSKIQSQCDTQEISAYLDSGRGGLE